jgi:predicted dithiol-disulfide oxidoreductase (DUF899 family)
MDKIMDHKIVSREEWLAVRRQHLADEKALTRARDELYRKRRALPWVKVEKTYTFQGPDGKETLSDLFAGKRQLIVNHFMFGPDWKEGCVGCSFGADHIDGALAHVNAGGAALVTVSRASLAQIDAFKQRMGWRFKWVSSLGSDFNYDFNVSFRPDEKRGKVFYNYEMQDFMSDELPGTSIFYKNEAGEIFHTYSAYARGDETLLGAFNFLDMTPLGRNETTVMDWVKHHDKYEPSYAPSPSRASGDDACCSSASAGRES